MNGYVEAGYVVVLATLGTYGATMVGRERAARRRAHKGTAPGSGAVVRPDDGSTPTGTQQAVGEPSAGPTS